MELPEAVRIPEAREAAAQTLAAGLQGLAQVTRGQAAGQGQQEVALTLQVAETGAQAEAQVRGAEARVAVEVPAGVRVRRAQGTGAARVAQIRLLCQS